MFEVKFWVAVCHSVNFGTTLNENLQDQFVCGLRSDVIRQRLFAEDETLTYANAVKVANSMEAAESDAPAVKPGLGIGDSGAASGDPAAVHALASGDADRHQGRRPPSGYS